MKQTFTIPFNQPHLSGKELEYIKRAAQLNKLSGNGSFTKKCNHFFEEKFGFLKALLTTSCTTALEMAAILLNLSEGDEIIAPSFTFPTTVIPFIRQGAKIVFVDSSPDNPNLDISAIPSLITKKTKAIILVHYAGIACDMDQIIALAKKHQLFVIEDAAQAINSYYKKTPLGKLGHFGTFSFHEQKNISCGEGGLLTINDPYFLSRAEIIREKGTNRAQFFRGEVDKYTWVDIGSSFLPSELNAAFLYAQLENLEIIQEKRISLWNSYFKGLKPLADLNYFQLPHLPSFATNNAHMFYLVCSAPSERDKLIQFLKENGIIAAFHFQSLHRSPFYKDRHGDRPLPYCDRYSDCLVRLPLFCDLLPENIEYIIGKITEFYQGNLSEQPLSEILPYNWAENDQEKTPILPRS